MKGIHGLILAIGLGIAGLLFNYAYLASKMPEMKMVGFIGIDPDVDIAPGEQLREEHFVRVDIPRRHVGNLEQFLVPYSETRSSEGYRMARLVPGGSLLLRQDLKPPRPELTLASNEAITWVPVDTRSMVPALIEPGDQVSFFVSTSPVGLLPPAEQLNPGTPQPMPESTGPIETIGPFTILSVGNRLGDPDIFKSSRTPRLQEQLVGIRVELDNQGNPMPHFQKLIGLLAATGNRAVGMMLHGRGEGTR